MTVKPGSLWRSVDDKKFRVIHVIDDQDNNTWVHYRDETREFTKDPKEYSCYLESFVHRFSPTPD